MPFKHAVAEETDGPFDDAVALVVGISGFKYQDENEKIIPDLIKIPGAAHSAGLVVEALRLIGFKEENIHPVVDHNATNALLRKKFEEISRLLNRGRRSLLEVYVTCHAIKQAVPGGEACVLLPWDGLVRQIHKGRNYCDSSITFKELSDFLDVANADQRVLILDVCHADGINRFERRSVVANFAACGAERPAYGYMKLGLFTKWILEARCGLASASDARKVMASAVKAYVEECAGKAGIGLPNQKPKIRFEVDFVMGKPCHSMIRDYIEHSAHLGPDAKRRSLGVLNTFLQRK